VITQLYKPLLQKQAILGAADFGARGETGYAPGEIGTIFIASAGPRQLANLVLEAGRVTTQLGPTRVLFDGDQVPLVSASRHQISFVTPGGLAAKAATTVIEVEWDEERSNPVELAVAPANPAFFALNATGIGQGAFLNLDFSVNGPSNPVPDGGFLILYATGGGEMDPPCPDGELAPSAEPLPRIKQPVRVLLDGGEVSVGYAGTAPGLICGVNQYNVGDPGLSGPTVSVQVCVGEICSQERITVAFE
jgi:uncharacterized protein (TIGR03437 family)